MKRAFFIEQPLSIGIKFTTSGSKLRAVFLAKATLRGKMTS